MLTPPKDLQAIMRPDEVLIRTFWVARGVSWKGNAIKRNGVSVKCKHKHRTQAGAERCAVKLRQEKFEKCPQFVAVQIYLCR